MLLRFFLFGCLGWCMEILWTSLYDLIAGTTRQEGDSHQRRRVSAAERWRLEGRTYLWMFPLYGSAALVFAPAHDALRGWYWLWRGLIYMSGIFAIEYLAGWVLERATGRCPWDYSYSRTSVHGFIRMDYAPAWFVLGMVLERAHDLVLAVEPAIRAAL